MSDDFCVNGSFVAGVDSDGDLEIKAAILPGKMALAFHEWLSQQIERGMLCH